MAQPMNLRPAVDRMIRLLQAVADDDLDGRTPCEDMTVRALIAHVRGFAGAFRAAAVKAVDERPDATDASAGRDPLAVGWRHEVAHELRELSEVWDQPSAWEAGAA